MKVVVMGGGTGTFPVVAALRRLQADVDTVIAVSDSGGSTGRIRDEFGFQPVGDLRQSLAALAENNDDWIRKILLYRFEKGDGLKGHNLGNLILTALQDMTGDTTQALEIAEKVFRITGQVIPVTTQNVNLKIHYQDGSTEIGEHVLDKTGSTFKKITDIELVPSAPLNPAAAIALKKAELVVIGPGDYYASLMAVLKVQGLPEALAASSAKVMYILNLMTRATQTANMTAADHLKGIETAIGRPVDIVVINNQDVPEDVLQAYAHEQEYPVVDDLGEYPGIWRRALLSDQVVQKLTVDTAHRSLLRHDRDKLQKLFEEVFSWQS